MLNGTAEQQLQSVHQKIITRSNIQKQEVKYKKQAEKIQQFLQALKSYKQGNKYNNKLQKLLNNLGITETIFNNLLTAINNMNLYNAKGKLLQLGSSTPVNIVGADNIFEEELATIIAIIAQQGTNMTNVKIDNYLIGSSYSKIDLKKDILDKISQDLFKQLGEKWKEEFTGSVPMGAFSSNIVPTPGKADVKGISINHKITYNEGWSKIVKLFANVSFTVKNYIAPRNYEDEKEELEKNYIHLGQTNFFKSIYSVLILNGYRIQFIKSILWNSVTEGRIGDKQEVFKHFQHLRYIYELTGGRMRDLKSNKIIPIPDFFIYNVSNRESIVVLSTRSMILDTLNKTTFTERYSIDIHKRDLLNTLSK